MARISLRKVWKLSQEAENASKWLLYMFDEHTERRNRSDKMFLCDVVKCCGYVEYEYIQYRPLPEYLDSVGWSVWHRNGIFTFKGSSDPGDEANTEINDATIVYALDKLRAQARRIDAKLRAQARRIDAEA